MTIDFLDLHKQYLSIKDEVDVAMTKVIASSAFIKSSPVTTFENEFAAYLKAEHVVSCGNGTDALEICLTAFGIGEGDEVLVPAMSWISTSEVVATRKATPVFVDIDAETYCIDVSKIEDKITEKTKAIIPVHLYGHPADMMGIIELAKKYNLKVIEDCAQAHGTEINGKKVGTFGDAATYSFFPTKNLGAFGDAGAIVVKDTNLKLKILAIANHGQEERHKHITHGRNSRMDGIQAAVLSVKLKYLEKWINLRRKIANQYKEELTGMENIKLPVEASAAKHAYHLYVIRAENRDGLKKNLQEKGIATMIHYPKALPFQLCYQDYDFEEVHFPVASKVQNEILSLPFYPEFSTEALKYVAMNIKDFYFEKA
ncbi:DegT/DnrJ/EryC1/StrS family aminotransferase [Autumnicola musiva]|uniref:DegT/DnrJ/EryC1/StrS family aminotransferase n=1 Tax=Autumnicola musiva TaxID=3075589 RepID=A0ABU3D346_9FLAO|nr:DegT/DnrJ/EryC1/StrS family aminotransferase [Zunongwangia sp. F117]MDT0675955.1 DegT/DnrJ/EryC1/StrS family aminotransferase [Zunongwangia sp. F117]